MAASRAAKKTTKAKPASKPAKKPATRGARSPALAEYQPVAPPSFQGEAGRLWKRILDDPDDLATRRIFADQLLEQGDPLGEYIQLAIQLDELDADDSRRAPLVERAEALRRHHLVPWTRAISALPPVDILRQPRVSHFAMHRGLVEELSLDVRTPELLPLAAAVAPIRRLVVDTQSNDFAKDADAWGARLGTRPELSRIRSLELEVEREGTAIALLASPHLRRLERLVLTAPATPRLARAIADSPGCAGLTELQLTNTHRDSEGIGAAGAAALAKLPLRSLTLAAHQLGDGLSAVVAMSTLRCLRIERGQLGAAGARIIAQAPALSGLRDLQLVDTGLGPRELVTVVSSPVLGALRALDLTGAERLNAKALDPLLGAWALEGLRTLRMSGSIRKAGAEAIVRARVLDRLESLSLRQCALGDDGAAALARWKPGALTHVNLDGNGIGPAGLGALARGPFLSNVRSLSLRKNKCGGDGGKALSTAKWLAHLRSLSLFYNWMTGVGVRAILENMPEAEELSLGENNYGTEPLRVAARGLLPNLLQLDLGTEANEVPLQAWLALDDTRRLRSLRVHHMTLSLRTVELLARLPELEDLQLSFCRFDDGVLDALHARFGGLLGFWPPDG